MTHVNCGCCLAPQHGNLTGYASHRSERRSALEAEFEKKVADIRESFEFFDRDNNGLIDFDEFRSLLKTVNPDASISQAAEGFSMTDTNSDGYVDLDEFIAWWRSNWWEY